MKKTLCAMLGATLMSAGMASIAAEHMGADKMGADKMGMDTKAVDTNGDGKITKEEYMAYQEKTWAGMKKDAMGMVETKSMMMPKDSMMKDKAM